MDDTSIDFGRSISAAILLFDSTSPSPSLPDVIMLILEFYFIDFSKYMYFIYHLTSHYALYIYCICLRASWKIGLTQMSNPL